MMASVSSSGKPAPVSVALMTPSRVLKREKDMTSLADTHFPLLAFLNIHWFLDKLGKTGSTLQLVNAFFLLSSYVLARLTFGVYNSYSWFMHVNFPVKAHSPRIPLHIHIFFTVGNVVLNSLNFIWFRAMIRAVQKRFTAKPADEKNGGKLDPRKIVEGKQKVKLGVEGTNDREFEREAGTKGYDYESHGSYSDSDREARWRRVAKKKE